MLQFYSGLILKSYISHKHFLTGLELVFEQACLQYA